MQGWLLVSPNTDPARVNYPLCSAARRELQNAAECGALDIPCCALLECRLTPSQCRPRTTDASRRAPGKSKTQNINIRFNVNNNNNTNTNTNTSLEADAPAVSRRDAMRCVWDTWCPWPSPVPHPACQLSLHRGASRAQEHTTIDSPLSAEASRETCPAMILLPRSPLRSSRCSSPCPIAAARPIRPRF